MPGAVDTGAMSETPWTPEQLAEARARLLRYSGLEADDALLREALAKDPEVAAELEHGYAEVFGLRDAVSQVLTGADWPAAGALEPIAEAALARGVPFRPVAERVALSADELEELRATLLDRYDVVISDALALETFRSEPDVYADYEDCDRALAYDTALRETFIGVVAERLVGRSWPIYADSKEAVQAFYAKLEEAVQPGYFDLNPAPDALVRRAARRRQRGDFPGALELLEQVLVEEPEHRGARLQRAYVRFAQEDYEVALRELEALALDHPEFMPMVRLRGLTLAELGRRDEAIACLQRFVDHLEPPPDPDGRVVRRRLIGMSRGALDEIKAKLAELRGG